MRLETKLHLPTVTLCAASSVNLPATVGALRRCLDLATFAECLLFTDDRHQADDPRIRQVAVERMRTMGDYSRFMLEQLVDHVQTDHVLVVQWDGFILDPGCWQDQFLQFDYVGAPWPQFDDGHDVGNGGFSLRSRRLLEACRDLSNRAADPEDVTICRSQRSMLEQKHGIRFAPRSVAEQFAFERTNPRAQTFGFHGVFNMISVLGPDRFWSMYQHLDQRSSVWTDYILLLRQLRGSSGATSRRVQLTLDRLRAMSRR